MSSKTSSRSTLTTVPSTMSPSLKYLMVSSIAARKASSDPMSLTATWGVEVASVLLVMWWLAPDTDIGIFLSAGFGRERSDQDMRAGRTGQSAPHHGSVSRRWETVAEGANDLPVPRCRRCRTTPGAAPSDHWHHTYSLRQARAARPAHHAPPRKLARRAPEAAFASAGRPAAGRDPRQASPP